MIQSFIWPPPDNWYEVVLLWDDMMEGGIAREVVDWCKMAPGARFHLHGYRLTQGFTFRFENAGDATMFALRWL